MQSIFELTFVIKWIFFYLEFKHIMNIGIDLRPNICQHVGVLFLIRLCYTLIYLLIWECFKISYYLFPIIERGRKVRVVNFQTGTSLHSLLERFGDIYSSVFIKSNVGFIWVTCFDSHFKDNQPSMLPPYQI